MQKTVVCERGVDVSEELESVARVDGPQNDMNVDESVMAFFERIGRDIEAINSKLDKAESNRRKEADPLNTWRHDKAEQVSTLHELELEAIKAQLADSQMRLKAKDMQIRTAVDTLAE